MRCKQKVVNVFKMTTNQNKEKRSGKRGKEKKKIKKEKPASDWAAHHSVRGRRTCSEPKWSPGFPPFGLKSICQMVDRRGIKSRMPEPATPALSVCRSVRLSAVSNQV